MDKGAHKPKDAPKPRDFWDICQILVMPVVLAILTIVSSCQLNKWQERENKARVELQEKENNARVYTELMSKREEAETALRKAMFDSIMKAFLESSGSEKSLEDEVLKIELLAYNFHESLNLAPLFKDLARKIERKLPGEAKDSVAAHCLRRLHNVTRDIVEKQIAALRSPGEEKNVQSGNFGELTDAETSPAESFRITVGEAKHEITLSITGKNPVTKELLVSLQVKTTPARPDPRPDQTVKTNAEFWISSFEFPKINNTRLPNDQRCALVLKIGEPDSKPADVPYTITVICFPGSRAALQEKPYYDEILDNLNHRYRTEQRTGTATGP